MPFLVTWNLKTYFHGDLAYSRRPQEKVSYWKKGGFVWFYFSSLFDQQSQLIDWEI